MSPYARAYTHDLLENITWSGIGKQNVQAKKLYCILLVTHSRGACLSLPSALTRMIPRKENEGGEARMTACIDRRISVVP